MAVGPKEIARPATAEPHQPEYGGLGPPALPRYRDPARPLPSLIDAATLFQEVTWRQGSKGTLTSRFAVLEVRPSGKEASCTAQEQAGGRNYWDGVLPLRTLLVEQPEEAPEPTGYWVSNLPVATPITDLVRWAKMRWRIEHDYRELEHGLGLDRFEGRTWRSRHHHVTSPPPPRPSSPCGGSTPKPSRRPDPLPGPRHPPGPAEVLERHLHHLRPTPADQQIQNLTKHF